MTENNIPKQQKQGGDYSLNLEEFKTLARDISEAGCYRRTPGLYLTLIAIILTGLGASIWLLTATDNATIQIGNAIIMGFFSVQLGLVGHDLSHGSVFSSRKLNRALAIIVWGLGCGLSEGRWYEKHNAHHQSPNHLGHDPDLEIPFVFDHEQAKMRGNFAKKWLFPYQHILFWIGLWLVYPYNILNSQRYILRQKTWRAWSENLLMLTHFIIMFFLTFTLLPTYLTILFNLTVFATMSLYMGLIFAPNHKGEDLILAEQEYNWVNQITLTRNITPSPVKAFLLGGLEHQIEHHLFPYMPRFQYKKARAIVQTFCRHRSIPYHETTWIESLRQIHQSLKAESKAWRQSSR